MKTIPRTLNCLVGLCVLNLLTAQWAVAADQSSAASGISTISQSSTPLSQASTNGLRFDFRGAPLDRILNYFSSAAGYVIYLHQGVSIAGTVDAFAAQPLSPDEAVHLLGSVLADHGFSVIPDGRTLNIYRTSEVTTLSPIKLGGDPGKIPNNAEVVTQIMPVRSLNPVEVNRVLTTLLPSGTLINVNESANTLIITAPQSVVRHAAELVSKLDSVSSSVNTLKVYPLKFADAKALADLVKQLFAAPDSARGNSGGMMLNFGSRGGNRGGSRSNFGNNSGSGSDNGATPQSRITAVADEHANSLIVSAPEPLLPGIEKLLAAVDVPVDDATQVHLFRLANADSSEMAQILQTLFPGTDSTDAGGPQINFPGQGGPGGMMVGAQQASSSESSERAKKLGQVLAVPDPRTSSLLVSASKSQMPEIIYVVEQLDSIAANRTQAFVIRVNNANLYDVQQAIQDLYPAGTTTSSASSSSSSDALKIRQTSLWQTQFSGSTSGSSSFGSVGSGSSTTRNGN